MDFDESFRDFTKRNWLTEMVCQGYLGFVESIRPTIFFALFRFYVRRIQMAAMRHDKAIFGEFNMAELQASSLQ